MACGTLDTFKVLERTKQIDPAAFLMNEDSQGLPADFVIKDDDRREAAYRAACAELERELGVAPGTAAA